MDSCLVHSEFGFSLLYICSVSGSPLHDVAVGGKLKRNKVIRVGVLGEDEKHGIKSGEERLKGVVGLMRLFQRNGFGFGFFELMRLWRRKFIGFFEFHHIMGLVLESGIWGFAGGFFPFIFRTSWADATGSFFSSKFYLSLSLFLPWKLFGLIIIFFTLSFF